MNFISLCKRALLALMFLSVAVTSRSQSEPVSQAANSMVDLLTGDFNYSLPVMTVPGPNGENVPINFNYHGGIRMDEEASWIGLGWNYNPGEITRNLNGTPDDWNDKNIITAAFYPEISSKSKTTRFFGPLYFANCNGNDTTNKMDIYSSGYKLDYGESFSFPDYDKFYVSGPGVSGQIAARVFAWGGFYSGNVSPYSHGSGPTFPAVASKRVHFYFENDINQSMGQTSGQYMGGTAEYSSATNRIYTGNCIEFFTNIEINNTYSTIKANGFIDYRIPTGTRRPNSEFDPDGVGAFQITTSNGMVYHYSLPVYTQPHEMNYAFNLNNFYEVDGSKELTVTDKVDRYAVSWKLTAVTGPDYYDLNDNGIADIGDTGYWIAYNYGKWTDNFNWRYPFYNYKHNTYDKRSPSNYYLAQYQYQTIKNIGSVSTGFTQRYYLNTIQTSTHTAYFIKDIRLDNHAVKESDGGIVPSLCLSKIILMLNSDLSSLNLTNNSFTLTPFSLANINCSVSSVIPHIGDYNANKTVFQFKSMATVELRFDYSLCKMVYNNIKNTFSPTPTAVFYNSYPSTSTELYKKFDHATGTSSSSDPANSGKLTLTGIKIYADAFKVTTPPYAFDYNQSDVGKNPNYSTFKSDYWGFNKSDFKYDVHGRYTTQGTTGSYLNVDAWSLKKITTPLGGEVIIDYESDKYEKTNYGGKTAFYDSPRLVFLIHTAEFTGLNLQTISVSKDVNDFISLPGILRRRVFMPFTIYTNQSGCGPFFARTIKDSCTTGCSGWNALTTTTGGTSGLQKFNFAFTYPPTGCASSGSVTKTLTYSPFNFINNPQQGWGYDNASQGWGYVRITVPYMYGGGVRVKQITMRDPTANQSYINEYTYEKGAAGSEPVNVFDFGLAIGANRNASDPHAPSAGVTYGSVTVRSKSLDNKYNGKMVYEFDNMLESFNIHVATKYTAAPLGDVNVTTIYTATEFIGALGRPLSVKMYDNNQNIVRSEVYSYNVNTDFLPCFKESFIHNLIETNVNNYHTFFNTTYIKTKVRSRLNGVITYKDGITTREEYVKFDPVTGEVITKRSIDPSTGIREIQTRLAYLDYPGMGPKLKNPGNQNLLSAVSKQTVYSDRLMRDIYNKLVGTGKPELIAGSKTTWRQSVPMRIFNGTAYVTQSQAITGWLPHKTYVFNGDVNDANWREESEITLFDTRQHPLEVKSGVSNRYSASRIGYNKQFELCSAADVKHADIAFSGFEDQLAVASGVIHFGGELTKGNLREGFPHTGNYGAKVLNGTTGPEFVSKGFTTGRIYRASVWVSGNSPSNAKLVIKLNGTVNGASVPEKSISRSDASNITSGSWILMTLTIDVPSNYVSASGTNDLVVSLKNEGSTPAYFDDFMLRPVDGSLAKNVLDERTGRTLATLDDQNFGTKYLYSHIDGRLITVMMEKANKGFLVKKRYTYNFSRSYN